MLFSISLIIFGSLILSFVMTKIKLPRIIGFMIAGILLGPYVLDLIDLAILDVSSELRLIALIVILIRAGLSLKMKDIKEIGSRAFLLSMIPASIEMVAIGLLAPIFFDITTLEAFILGSVIAAVSPAIIVPRMIELIKLKRGTNKKIPQLILAAASMDDVYVIIIFTSLIQAYSANTNFIFSIISIPLSIISGTLIGISIGYLLVLFFKKYHLRDTLKVLIIFGFAFLIVSLEKIISSMIPFSGLIGVIFIGITIDRFYERLANRLVLKFEKIWVISEIMLFVLVGAVINIYLINDAGLWVIMLIMIALIFRISGVFLSLIKSRFNHREKLFVGVSYIPKATVQAAIGAVPLSLGLPSGDLILVIAVISIIITAPIGAIGMDFFSPRLLTHDK